MDEATEDDDNNSKILYTPIAYDTLIRYIDKVNEYQNSINDELATTRDHVRHLEAQVYRLQATMQALTEHITSTANVISPQDFIPTSQVNTNTTITIRSNDDIPSKISHRTSKKRRK